MEPVVIAVLVGVAVYVAVIALLPRRLFTGPNYTQTMLDKLEQESNLRLVSEESRSLFRDQIDKTTLGSRLFFSLPGAQRLYPKLLKAGLHGSIDVLMLVTLVALMLCMLLFRNGGIWGVVSAFAVVALGLWWFINSRIAKRNKAFIALFPDALDMIVRSVKSGYPLNAAVRMVADNMQPPVSTEFKQVADETSYGSPLIESLQRLSYRIDEPDIRFFVVVLAVQQEVGGNLAEVLTNLSSIIRKRRHLHMKIRALSSEGRATAWVLGLLPVFEFLAIYLVAPTHLTPLFTTTLGNLVLASAIGIVLLGVVLVRQLIHIEV